MTAFDQVVLSTQRLLLRPLAAADAGALMAIYADPEVMRYGSSPPWDSIEKADAQIVRDREAMAAGHFLRLGLQRVDDGALIGTCTLFNLDPPCRRAEIGYALAVSAWSRGYMCEALPALIDFGFEAMDLNRIEADIDPRNTASTKSIERQGFVREGYLRERWIVQGVFSDTALYALLRSDWQAQRRKVASG
ncbi:acetyltransferase family protein [Lysobacter antibioticus]|uniref:GNAT family N-acetyltransferase n=1 Tax=Lysobacter antibioticus TaxID=84531 RepID=UPI0007170E32|nr:GNAT family protein [Lysobacter antibioticus]ALN61366.1 acetyltransferase family protein [Lysobacter antibioticus]